MPTSAVRSDSSAHDRAMFRWNGFELSFAHLSRSSRRTKKPAAGRACAARGPDRRQPFQHVLQLGSIARALAIMSVALACRPTEARMFSKRPATRRLRTASRIPVELEEHEGGATSTSAASEECHPPFVWRACENAAQHKRETWQSICTPRSPNVNSCTPRPPNVNTPPGWELESDSGGIH